MFRMLLLSVATMGPMVTLANAKDVELSQRLNEAGMAAIVECDSGTCVGAVLLNVAAQLEDRPDYEKIRKALLEVARKVAKCEAVCPDRPLLKYRKASAKHFNLYNGHQQPELAALAPLFYFPRHPIVSKAVHRQNSPGGTSGGGGIRG